MPLWRRALHRRECQSRLLCLPLHYVLAVVRWTVPFGNSGRLCGDGAEQPDPMAVYDDFQKVLLQRYETRGVETIGGAEDSFVWLRKRNVKIALTTGFYRNPADRLLRRVGWEGSFDAVVCNDDIPRGRPALT